MNNMTFTLKNAIELFVSIAVVLAIVTVALTSNEYSMAALFVLALMVPVTSSFAVQTWRGGKSLVLRTKCRC